MAFGVLALLPTKDTNGHESFLSTDDTDATVFVRAVLVLWGMYTSRVAALPTSSADVLPRWSNALLYSELMATLLLRGEGVCPGKHA